MFSLCNVQNQSFRNTNSRLLSASASIEENIDLILFMPTRLVQSHQNFVVLVSIKNSENLISMISFAVILSFI